MKWSYGVTTVKVREGTYLPRTLASLVQAGFDSPRVFLDASPCIGAYGNWILSLWQLYLREPHADRYAVFQDDLAMCRGVKRYLERCPYMPKTYLNLYTAPQNEAIVPRRNGATVEGWYNSNQLGRGAVALVFDRDTAVTLLSSRHMVERVQNAHRGMKSIDGGVVQAMKDVGYVERVHYPTLVKHVGDVSTLATPEHPHQFAPCTSFKEAFDPCELLL